MGELKVLLCFCLIGLATTEILFTGQWVENQGWNVTCSWKILDNDTLQSLTVYRNDNDNPVLVYRPEKNGLIFNDVTLYDSFVMTKRCLSYRNKRRGKCIIIWEPNENVTEDTYKCEISGERPTFRQEKDYYTIFAPPSDAVMNQIPPQSDQSQTIRPTLNCTSSGLPPPKLIWTVEGQKIPEDFTHTAWNSTSKLWDSWSSYNPQDSNAKVLCTPQVVTKNGRMVKGTPAVWYHSPSNGEKHYAERLQIVIFSVLAMLHR